MQFVVAASARDRRVALRLRQALVDRGADAKLLDYAEAPTKAMRVLALCSPSALREPELGDWIDQFSWLAGRHKVYLIGVETETPVPPLSLQAERRPDGSFWRGPRPPVLGALYTDESSIERLADRVLRQAQPSGVLKSLSAGARTAVLPPRPGAWSMALGGVCAVSVAVAIWQAGVAAQFRSEASQSQAFASRLLTDLTENLPNTARRETLVRLADMLSERYLDADMRRLSDDEVGRRAQLFNLIGEARDVNSDPVGAREAFMAAFAHTEALLARRPDDPERLYNHAQSAFWLGASAYRSGALESAASYWTLYADLAERMVALAPGNLRYQTEQAYAELNLGIVDLDRGEADAALSRFAAAEAVLGGPALDAGLVGDREVANVAAWQADAYFARGELEAALAARQRQIDIYVQRLEETGEVQSLRFDLAQAQHRAAGIATALGRTDEALGLLDAALEVSAQRHEAAPENDRFARRYVSLIADRARLALWNGELMRAQLLLGEARRTAARSNEAGESDHLFLPDAVIHKLAAEIALASGAWETAVLEAGQARLSAERALSDNQGRARGLIAWSEYLHGEALTAAGQPLEGREAYRRARVVLMSPDYQDSPLRLDLLSRVHWRLGDYAAALQERSALEAIGYARSDFVQFWAEADREATASMTSENGEEL